MSQVRCPVCGSEEYILPLNVLENRFQNFYVCTNHEEPLRLKETKGLGVDINALVIKAIQVQNGAIDCKDGLCVVAHKVV